MTAPVSVVSPQSVHGGMGKPLCLSSGEDRHKGKPMRRTSRLFREHREASREIASDLLWRSFGPGTENEVCNRAAPVLEVHPDTVRNVLRKRVDAKLSLIFPLLLLALASKGIDALEALGDDE